MAIQTGIIRVTGSAGDLTSYRLRGEYYVRIKSSLTAKEFWNRKCFENSRTSCRRFAQGNKLASKVYRSLPKSNQVYTLFCSLKTAAIHYLKLGLTPNEAYTYVLQHAQQQQFNLPVTLKKRRRKKVFPYITSVTSRYFVMPASRYYNMAIKMGVEELAEYASTTFHSIVPPVYRRCNSKACSLLPLPAHHRYPPSPIKGIHRRMHFSIIESIAPYPPAVRLDYLMAA